MMQIKALFENLESDLLYGPSDEVLMAVIYSIEMRLVDFAVQNWIGKSASLFLVVIESTGLIRFFWSLLIHRFSQPYSDSNPIKVLTVELPSNSTHEQ